MDLAQSEKMKIMKGMHSTYSIKAALSTSQNWAGRVGNTAGKTNAPRAMFLKLKQGGEFGQKRTVW